MAKAKLSRFEVNKKVRRILVRNGVDISYIQFSFVGRTVTFSGRLQKDDGREFSATSLENMLQDIYKIGVQVFSELENWSICDGSISKKGEKKKDKEKDKEKESQDRQEVDPSSE